MYYELSPLPGNLVKKYFNYGPVFHEVLFGLSDMFSVQFISQPLMLFYLLNI
jgi:hypothetical protein